MKFQPKNGPFSRQFQKTNLQIFSNFRKNSRINLKFKNNEEIEDVKAEISLNFESDTISTRARSIPQDEGAEFLSDFVEQMRITDELIQRSRTVSQESYHSNPKSWSDFSAETKEWRVSEIFN